MTQSPGASSPKIRSRERFLAGLKRQSVAVDRHDGQAAAVDRDAVADLALRGDLRLANHEPHARRLGDDIAQLPPGFATSPVNMLVGQAFQPDIVQLRQAGKPDLL